MLLTNKDGYKCNDVTNVVRNTSDQKQYRGEVAEITGSLDV